MGEFFDSVFQPAMKKRVDAQLSPDELNRVIQIPATLGREDQR
jgi:hypothetical protein